MTGDEPVPIFLTVDEVSRIHQDQLGRYGGEPGVLSVDKLHSAVAQPQATFGGQFLHSDVFEMAAVYLFHLAQNHAFVDGNKRVGLASAAVFLAMNGYEINASDDDLYEIVISVARGETRRDQVADFFREKCV